MEFQELKSRSIAEMAEMKGKLQTELRELRFKALSRQLKTVHKISQLRRDLARILTELQRREKTK